MTATTVIFFGERRILALYTVSDKYIDYLRNAVPIVYDSHKEDRVHERKYIGIVIQIGEFSYFAPLSSPKPKDYMPDGKTIRRSSLTILRIVRYAKEKQYLLGTVRLSNMIPVPASEICPYDIHLEADMRYRDVVTNELYWIEHNDTQIIRAAKRVYNMKTHEGEIRNDKNAKTLDAIVPFFELQQLCTDWHSND